MAANANATATATETKATSSLVGELKIDVEIKAEAKKFYDMFTVNFGHLPKAIPGCFQGCEVMEGEWNKVGTIFHMNYLHAGHASVAREMIKALEPEKNLIKFEKLEGDMMQGLKSFYLTIQVTPKQGGTGSVVKYRTEYERNDENSPHVPDTLLGFLTLMAKDIDEYLMSHQ